MKRPKMDTVIQMRCKRDLLAKIDAAAKIMLTTRSHFIRWAAFQRAMYICNTAPKEKKPGA